MAQYNPPAPSLGGDSLPPRSYAWLVFALTFALLLSDYMSRQVLNAVFPLLKLEWGISDAKLGALSSIVALTVGLLTLPISLLADKYGRIRCLVIMALLWSLATLACGFARTYEEMLVARFFVGLGEAAFGAVGLAVALSVFPVHMRATITGAFMAGGLFGSVLGIAAGGAIAAQFGWRVAFYAMAAFGLVFAVIYPMLVRERWMLRAPAGDGARRASGPTGSLRNLFTNPILICLYAASGVQMFLPSALMAWTPSYMERYYGMQTAQAASFAAILVLCGGVGMVVLGMVSDRRSRAAPASGQQVRLAMIYCAVSAASLFIGFALPPGPMQFGFIALGFFFSAGMAGPTGSMVTQLSHVSFHATALAVLTLVNNILGLAPGPFVTGVIADHIGLRNALLIMPVMGLIAMSLYRIALSLWQQQRGKFPVVDGIG